MAQSKVCRVCVHATDCQKTYERLGRMEGPSVVLSVVAAFVLPVVVFVAVLAVSGWLLAGTLAQRFQTPVAFALALAVTIVVTLAASLALKRRDRNTQCPDTQSWL